LSWLAEGKIAVPIKAVFPLDQIREAHREYASSAGRGSIILAIGR
jgi:NADPH:quinone reductase-like Zn-dependent oxidoreductase